MDVLLAMGFDVSTAERALQLNQGDVERSLDALLTGKVKPLDTQQVKMTTVPSSTKVRLKL